MIAVADGRRGLPVTLLIPQVLFHLDFQSRLKHLARHRRQKPLRPCQRHALGASPRDQLLGDAHIYPAGRLDRRILDAVLIAFHSDPSRPKQTASTFQTTTPPTRSQTDPSWFE